MNFKVHLAKTEHEVAYSDLIALVGKHADKITPVEILAIAANMVGKLIAMQDQREMSPTEALQLVSRNMEHGNQEIIDELDGKGGYNAD
jgi:hypothetical protein